jgi:microcompartment protein CcmK/EutM
MWCVCVVAGADVAGVTGEKVRIERPLDEQAVRAQLQEAYDKVGASITAFVLIISVAHQMGTLDHHRRLMVAVWMVGGTGLPEHRRGIVARLHVYGP